MKLTKAIVEPWAAAHALGALAHLDGLHYVAASQVVFTSGCCTGHCPDANTCLEVLVPDDGAGAVVEIFSAKACAGRMSRGHIFILDIPSAVCLRCGERDGS